MTYTVVAMDRGARSMALGTVSHSTSVLAKVLTRASVEEREVLVASQAFSSPALGAAVARHTLDGGDPREVPAICRASPGGAFRQVALVSSSGKLGAYTGARCVRHAGHLVDVDAGVAVAGNMLRGPEVLDAAHSAFLESRGALDERVLAALTAASGQGGDARGDRAAGLMLVEPGGVLHLSVDDHESPHRELERLRAQARSRSILSACYEWVIRGCPSSEAAYLAGRLAPGGEQDPELAVWAVIVSDLGGLPPPPVSIEVAARATDLLARMSTESRSEQSQMRGALDVG